MPAYLPVPSLSFLSLETVADLVVTTVTITNLNHHEFTDECEMALQEITDYVAILPPNISEEFLHYILNIEDFDPIVRYWALRLFLQPHTRSLAIGVFPETYYTRIVEVVILQGTGLHMLDMKGVWLNHDNSHLLEAVLENVTNLTSLHIPHMANDRVLEILGQNSRSLQVLDISGDTDVTENGTMLLCTLKTSLATSLQIVNIGNPGGVEVDPNVAAPLVRFLPNLISLGTYAHVGRAIACVLSEEPDIGLRTNLQHLHDTNTDITTADIIIRTCPCLQSLYLDQPQSNVICKFRVLPHLQELKLHKFQCDELFSLIAENGHSLSTLELILGYGVLNLSKLATDCPNLSKLICYKIDCIRHLEQTPFENLKKFGVFYSDISMSCIKYMLTCCIHLEEMSFGDLLDITDTDIAEVLTLTRHDRLTDVWLPNARNLTTHSVQTFIENCPNLRSLGELSGWNVLPEDIAEFRAAIQAENIDLKLWEFFG